MHAVTAQVPSWSFWGSSFLESRPCDVPSPENNDKRLAKVHWIPIQRCVSKVLVEGIKSLLVLNNSQEFFQCIQLPLRYLHILLGVHPFWVKNPVILAHLKVKKGINSEFSLYKWSCSRLEQCRRRCMGESAKTTINRDFQRTVAGNWAMYRRRKSPIAGGKLKLREETEVVPRTPDFKVKLQQKYRACWNYGKLEAIENFLEHHHPILQRSNLSKVK